MTSHKISKSRYLKGLQCQKLLWLAVNEPDAEELKPDIMAEHRFAVGHKVGALARDRFPGGVLVENTGDFQNWLSATSDAIRKGKEVIYEAAFANDSAFVAVDILTKSADGWDIIEVKSGLSVKDTHIDDLIIQRWVLEKAGLKVNKTYVMTLNKECVHPDFENLFKLHDVTDRVQDRVHEAETNLPVLQVSLIGSIPNVKIGKHCDAPYECPFKSRCWPEQPEHHISTLYRLNKDTALDLEHNQGISEIHHLLDEIKLNQLQQRQVHAVKTGEAFVSKELKGELENIKGLVAYLDFETIMPAIPIFNGDSPYQQIPAQFSCHIDDGNGDLKHVEWIATDASDPRVGIVEKLLEACEDANTIVAYNAKFEKMCLDAIARAVPEKADRILALKDRFFDLLPLVRNNVYDPMFKGSFSIKSVLPALVPDASYQDLEIANGMIASIRLEQIITSATNPNGENSTVSDLLKYCAMDSYAMLLLRNAVQRLADEQT